MVAIGELRDGKYTKMVGSVTIVVMVTLLLVGCNKDAKNDQENATQGEKLPVTTRSPEIVTPKPIALVDEPVTDSQLPTMRVLEGIEHAVDTTLNEW
ncbi:hypothetical protein I6N90_18280 [Paenibacillus sp. GSMTC-2017]|uniref:hypothetical protein n=1 Tax=Paenibacillus sp. GSMTC-2017 TaxID=2794350 RepID=UPI0018D7B549|nr:hypothetical protein [Paenibacillus sp. GSMTC-2017]MBH5319749.1 hypothetical protein [Paenibacillus sp. GSMTC-2017]